MTRHLFHFDLKPRNNYGDTVLFELVRQLFDGYSGREKFLVTDTTNLRHVVGPRTVERINAESDAVVLGGGGLMLRSTNENANAGWQWNIGLDRLAAIAVPLVVFAVGYNRFEGEPEFEPVFTEHLNATVEKAAFFGVRNHGSMEAVRGYLRPELAPKVLFQPCPTTVASHLVPDLYVPDLAPERRVGLQVTFEARNELAGFDGREVFAGLLTVARDLRRRGYELDVISHSDVDDAFADHLRDHGVPARHVRLHAAPRGLFDGLAYYGRLPLTIGMRGHGQMIPFGMGNGIVSVAARRKLAYFVDDLGRPDLAVEPRGDGWTTRVLDLVERWFGDPDGERAAFAVARERLWRTTLDNLGLISSTLTGDAGDPDAFVPMTPFERELALNTYTSARTADVEAERAQRLRDELIQTRSALARAERDLRRSQEEIARGGLHLIYRNARRQVGRVVRQRRSRTW